MAVEGKASATATIRNGGHHRQGVANTHTPALYLRTRGGARARSRERSRGGGDGSPVRTPSLGLKRTSPTSPSGIRGARTITGGGRDSTATD